MSLDPSRIALNEHKNADWVMTVEENTSMETVLKPDFYANVAARMHPYDRIRVRIDTGEWYCELLVVDCGRAWAKVVKIFEVDLTGDAPEVPRSEAFEQFVVKHRGPHLNWCVLRKADKEPLKEMCATKQEAEAWLASYVMTL